MTKDFFRLAEEGKKLLKKWGRKIVYPKTVIIKGVFRVK